MSRPTLEVELARHASTVRGFRAREWAEEVTGKAPVWITTIRAWSVSEETARSVVVLAERAGHDVVVTGRRSRREQLLAVLMAAPLPGAAAELDGAGERLW